MWLDKGDFQKNVHTVCPCQNKCLYLFVFGSCYSILSLGDHYSQSHRWSHKLFELYNCIPVMASCFSNYCLVAYSLFFSSFSPSSTTSCKHAAQECVQTLHLCTFMSTTVSALALFIILQSVIYVCVGREIITVCSGT